MTANSAPSSPSRSMPVDRRVDALARVVDRLDLRRPGEARPQASISACDVASTTSTVLESCVLTMSMSTAFLLFARLPTVPSSGAYVTFATSPRRTILMPTFGVEELEPPEDMPTAPTCRPSRPTSTARRAPACACILFCDAVTCFCRLRGGRLQAGIACVSICDLALHSPRTPACRWASRGGGLELRQRVVLQRVHLGLELLDPVDQAGLHGDFTRRLPELPHARPHRREALAHSRAQRAHALAERTHALADLRERIAHDLVLVGVDRDLEVLDVVDALDGAAHADRLGGAPKSTVPTGNDRFAALSWSITPEAVRPFFLSFFASSSILTTAGESAAIFASPTP